MTTNDPSSPKPPDLAVPIEVPEIAQCSGAEFTVVEYVHFLLTRLFRHEAALLHAQFQDGTGVWLLRERPKGIEGPDVEIARIEGISLFRAVLARFGYYYMAVQLYGGVARRILIQRGRKYACSIYMSNDNSTGYWIRVYAHILAEQGGCTEPCDNAAVPCPTPVARGR